MVTRKTATPRRAVAVPGRAATTAAAETGDLLADLRRLIQDAQRTAAVAVNVSLTMLYWRVGMRIREEVLRHKRAAYGEQIVATLSRELAAEYERGFEEKNLRRMLQFEALGSGKGALGLIFAKTQEREAAV